MVRPDDPEINFYLGRLALWFDQNEEGLARLEKAARSVPTDARNQNAMGDACGLEAQKAGIFTKIGWARKCLAAYLRAAALDPRNADYHWSLLEFYQLAPAFIGGGMDKAEAEAANIALLDPKAGRIASAVLGVTQHHYDQAFDELEAVVRAAPDDFTALYQIGRCAALSGQRLERGLEALRHCLQLPQPSGAGKPKYVNIHFRLGSLLEKKGDREGAKAEYRAALADNPEFQPARDALKN